MFVSSATPFDVATSNSLAAVWNIIDGSPQQVAKSNLEMINEVALAQDEQLSVAIQKGENDALVLISSDPTHVNSKVISAAAAKAIPAVGSGGTSVSKAMELGLSPLVM